MTPSPQPEYFCNDDDLMCLNNYFYAALDQNESKTALIRLWEQEFGVIRSRPYQSSRDKMLKEPEGNNLYFTFAPEPVGGNSRLYINFSDADCFSVEITDSELEKLSAQLTDFMKLRQKAGEPG